MTINSGLLFSRKYESGRNAIRRFLLANEGFSKERFEALRKATDPNIAFLGFVQKYQSSEYWNGSPWLSSENWDAREYGAVTTELSRQCPLCASAVFDCHCFRYPWMKRCPLHGVSLTNRCPDCDQPWPEYQKLQLHRCSTCGTTRPKKHDERRRQIQPHTKAQVETLDLCWLLPHIDNKFCYVLYQDYVNHGLDRGIVTGSREFPELAIALLPESKEFFELVGAPTSGYLQKQFQGTALSLSDVREMPVSRPLSQVFVLSAISEVDEELRSELFGSLNRDLSLDLPQYVHIDSIEDYETADLVYNAWRFITRALADQATTTVPSGWWTRMFEILRLPQPEMPPVVNFLISDEQVIDPSNQFRKWMYKRQLTNLFLYLYRHALFFKLRIINNRQYQFERELLEGLGAPHEEKSPGTELGWPRRYMAFRVRILENNQLHVVFRPDPVLSKDGRANLQMHLMEGSSGVGWQEEDNSYAVLKRYLIASQSNNLLDCILREMKFATLVDFSEGEIRQLVKSHKTTLPYSLSDLSNHFGRLGNERYSVK